MPFLAYGAIVLAAYLMGSIPTGYLVARTRGIDLRRAGSGNIGATNALRVLGKPAGIFVLLVDALKGAVACLVLPGLAASTWPAAAGIDRSTAAVAAGVAAILGHNFTCWLRFKGGKGIATSAGVLAVIMPAGLGIALGLWIVVFALTRYVSLASMLAAAVLPFAVWITRGTRLEIGVATVLGLLALWRHQANFRRLLAGSEPRVGQKPKGEDPLRSPR